MTSARAGRPDGADGAGPAAGAPADAEGLVARVNELTERLETMRDPADRALAEDLVGAIMDLYGEGLARIGQALAAAGPAGEEIKRALVADGVVGSLLLIHDLHPVALEARVLEALETVRPYLGSHGGDVELVGIEGGVARLRLEGSCRGCPASAATLELAIEQALAEAAPDLAGLEVEGLAVAKQPGPAEPARSEWHPLDGVGELAPGALAAASVAGVELVVANVQGELLAYRNACAACAGPLHEGELVGGTVACPSCGRRYSLPLAGRALEGDGLQLEPVPLLREEGSARVALAA